MLVIVNDRTVTETIIELPALRFADTARRLGAAAHEAGLSVPAFRSPPPRARRRPHDPALPGGCGGVGPAPGSPVRRRRGRHGRRRARGQPGPAGRRPPGSCPPHRVAVDRPGRRARRSAQGGLTLQRRTVQASRVPLRAEHLW